MKSEIYETFMKEYRIKHEVCPKCGTKPHNSTLMGVGSAMPYARSCMQAFRFEIKRPWAAL